MKKCKPDFWLFIGPALLAFVIVMIIPFVLGVYYSFTDWDGVNIKSFTGFENYKKIFKDDIRFIYSIILTTVYSIFNIVIMSVVALSLALLVTQKLKLRNLFRAGFFMPNLIGGLILGYIWQFVFNRVAPDFFNTDYLMLANRNTAVLALIITGVWQYAGYLMVIFITALQNIPTSLTEAAMIDGATAVQRFRHITLPMIAPAFTITTFLTILYSFKQFDVNYSLTSGGPSTMFAGQAIKGTEFISLNIINESESYHPEIAQAKAIIFFFAILLVSLVQIYYNKKKEIEI